MPFLTPIIRQTAWISLVPQLIVMGLLIYGFHLLRFSTPSAFIYGALAYLTLSSSLRKWLKKHHKEGMRLVKEQDFENAILSFEKSVAFFTRNTWIDKYRFLTMLDSSQISYKEMGLTNIAFCYYRMGDTEMAKAHYEGLLSEFPESKLANASLTMLNTP